MFDERVIVVVSYALFVCMLITVMCLLHALM